MQKETHGDGTSEPSDAIALPGWLRARHSAAIQTARKEIELEAKRTGAEAGMIADRRVRSILAECLSAKGPPSSATVAAYRRDYAIM